MLMVTGEDLRMVLSFSAWERSTPASSPRTRIEIGINVGGPFSTARTSMRAPGTRAESASWSGAISGLVSSLCELKQELRVMGRGRLGWNGDPESRSARPDKTRHGSQYRLSCAVTLRRLFLHHGLCLADGLFRGR